MVRLLTFEEFVMVVNEVQEGTWFLIKMKRDYSETRVG